MDPTKVWSRAVLVSLLLSASADAELYSHTGYADCLNLSMATLPNSATASLAFAPVGKPGAPITWALGPFAPNGPAAQWITLDQTTAAAAGINWSALNGYFVGQSVVNITETLDGAPLYVSQTRQFDALSKNQTVSDVSAIKFRLSNFVTDINAGKFEGFISGDYSISYVATVPEPSVATALAVVCVVGLFRRKRGEQ